MILAALAVLFLMAAAIACLALAGAVAYMVLVVVPAALEVATITPPGLIGASLEEPTRAVIAKDETSKRPIAVSNSRSVRGDRRWLQRRRQVRHQRCCCPMPPANVEVENTSSLKEISIGTGVNYGSASSTITDSSTDLADENLDSELDNSLFLSSEVDSEFFRAGDLDVDWELETIASVHSSSALDDTDYLLGGESFDSEEQSDSGEDADLYLRDWSSEIDSICSSLNDTDYLLGGESYDSDLEDSFVASASADIEQQDAVLICSHKPGGDESSDDHSSEDETDKEELVQLTVQPIASAIKLAPIEYTECIARAIASGAVSVERGSGHSTLHKILAANHTLSIAATVAVKPVSLEEANTPEAERVAVAKPVAPTVVRSRLFAYKASVRFVAEREANLTRAIRSKSAMVKASRFQ